MGRRFEPVGAYFCNRGLPSLIFGFGALRFIDIVPIERGRVLPTIDCHKTALRLSLGCAVLLTIGTIWHQELWQNYSPVSRTVSSLSALGVPHRESMTGITLIGATFLVAISLCLNHCGKLGRIFLAVAGLSLAGVALFPVPSVLENSNAHTFFAAIFLIAMCLWPVAANFGTQSHLWAVSIRRSFTSSLTLALLGICFWLNWLISTPIMGLIERIFLLAQFSFLNFVIWSSRIGLQQRVCIEHCKARLEAASLKELTLV